MHKSNSSYLKMKEYALITGGAAGLGKAFAHELSGRGYNIILVDLPGSGLSFVCDEIERNYGNNVVYFECDLTEIDSMIEMTKAVNEKYDVSVLINNAGIGGTRRFEDADLDYINNIIRLNVTATTVMVKLLLPNLKRQPKSFVLNVSSMAAFSPIAFKTVYPASKAFVHSFTRGMHQEYKKTNVFFSVVYPGPMKTNADVTARINSQGLLGRLGLLSPQKVARLSVNQLFRRDPYIIFSTLNWLFMTVTPVWFRLPILSSAMKRELKRR
jgi:uncharacterized protein